MKNLAFIALALVVFPILLLAQACASEKTEVKGV
jgi:hypothetical protein